MFRVHRVYQEWISTKMGELESFQVDQSNLTIDMKTRRLSLHNPEHDSVDDVPPSIRSVFVFEANAPMMNIVADRLVGKGCLLKVVDLENVSITNVPDDIGQLYHLRYSSLRNTRVEVLPTSIGKLVNLQTLDLRGSLVCKLPIEVKQLRALRNLLIYRQHRNNFTGFRIPYGVMGKLKELQKVAYLDLSDKGEEVSEMGSLKNLKTLAICDLKDSGSLCKVIDGLSSLEILKIGLSSRRKLDLEPLTVAPPFVRKIQIHLRGRVDRFPKWKTQLKYLEELELAWSNLTEDPGTVLKCLPNLMLLVLWDAYRGSKMRFSNEGFQNLKVLHVARLPILDEVVIEEGSLPPLEELTFESCFLMKDVPPGIEHLKNLQKLFFRHASGNYGQLPARCRS